MKEVQSIYNLMTVTGVTVGDYVRVLDTGSIYEWISGDKANLNNWLLANGLDGYKYKGGVPIGVGYSMQTNRALDERDIVNSAINLAIVPNCYPGIVVKVADEDYRQYQWNGIDQTNFDNYALGYFRLSETDKMNYIVQ